MFIRKKKNVGGSVSVQIIEKRFGKYVVLRTMGSSKNASAVELLCDEAQTVLAQIKHQQVLDLSYEEDVRLCDMLSNINNAQIHTIGPELVFGTLFDSIGFSAVKDSLFRHLVIARLAFPLSKLKTVDYMRRYKGVEVDVSSVYRSLDRLHKHHKTTIEQITYNHTKKILGTISVIFYDMTTLYFEAEDEDDLRKIGFSKDGKFDCPQIMLGLLVGEGGYPIGYDIFEGNTYEGKTFVPILTAVQEKYGFDKPIVVADAGLLSKKNIKEFIKKEYTFILGARIKNETDVLKAKILECAKDMKNGDSFVIKKDDGTRLIVTYKDNRAKKDAHNREKGLGKLRKKVEGGKLTKTHVNNRGYNRFLMLSGEMTATIDEARVEADSAWDGLKGYVTNTKLSSKKVVEHYSHLWQIERAFRISKTDLRIRPVYHYKRRRIEAHICIAFVAYTIWKELERLLKKAGVEMSAKRAGELAQNMYEICAILPKSQNKICIKATPTNEQQILLDILRVSR